MPTLRARAHTLSHAANLRSLAYTRHKHHHKDTKPQAGFTIKGVDLDVGVLMKADQDIRRGERVVPHVVCF